MLREIRGTLPPLGNQRPQGEHRPCTAPPPPDGLQRPHPGGAIMLVRPPWWCLAPPCAPWPPRRGRSTPMARPRRNASRPTRRGSGPWARLTGCKEPRAHCPRAPAVTPRSARTPSSKEEWRSQPETRDPSTGRTAEQRMVTGAGRWEPLYRPIGWHRQQCDPSSLAGRRRVSPGYRTNVCRTYHGSKVMPMSCSEPSKSLLYCGTVRRKVYACTRSIRCGTLFTTSVAASNL